MDTLIAIEEAVYRLQKAVDVCSFEEIAVEDAYGRVLAVDVCALLDVPHYDRAMLDGFAVQAIDIAKTTREHPVELEIIETVGAGKMPSTELTSGTAVRTMTGAPIAKGADAIVRLEYADEIVKAGTRIVRVYRAVGVQEAIQQRGHDIRRGDILLQAGTVLSAVEIAVLAANGFGVIQVTRRPRVAIVATGSEVVPLGQPLQPGQLYNSNTPMLRSLVLQTGGTAASFLPVGDDPQQLKTRFEEALDSCDVLVTTGGVSVGDYDLTPVVLENLGVKRLFWGVWMRPGTPIYAGVYEDRIVLALSGNPAAAYVNALLLLVPLLRKMSGQKFREIQMKARLKNPPHKRRVKHTRFFAGDLVLFDNEVWIDVSGEHSSGVMTNFIAKTALARVESDDELVDGTLVNVILL